MQIPQSVCELVATGPLAHLTTVNPDGSPQVTVVWVGIDNDEFVMGHLGMWKKVQNIRRDPRVALSMLGPNTNAQGLRESLVVYGGARITEGRARLRRTRCAMGFERQLVAESITGRAVANWNGVVVIVERIAGASRGVHGPGCGNVSPWGRRT